MDFKPLFIFEMANNHQGDVEHGKRIIHEIRSVCDKFPEFDYAFKFQYRNLDTFIHPNYQDRMDIKNVKRFRDTRLTMEQFAVLLDEVRSNNFIAICTPFDEISVDRIYAQKYDYIKIASCSFTDWPLLEKIATTKMPVIASGAGSSLENIERVVSFFSNRGISFSLMHCIAEYPTANSSMEMNQIDVYHNKFPGIRVGFSTHENPNNTLPIQLAIAKGAQIFEKHVGVPTDTITLNGYSANPAQVEAWLNAAREAYSACGSQNGRYVSSEKEQSDLAALKRGVFAKKTIGKGTKVQLDDLFFAFPCQEGQLVTSDLSKYNCITVDCEVPSNAPIMCKDVSIENISNNYMDTIKKICALLKDSNVVVPAGSVCEISHHYGIEKFTETGVAMIDCVNREYCKKILIVLPNQNHPAHYHEKKEETFVILHGDLQIILNGQLRELHKGDVMTVERGVNHSFSSKEGCVFEEISTTHYINDSYYELAKEFCNPRKTKIHMTKDMLSEINGNDR